MSSFVGEKILKHDIRSLDKVAFAVMLKAKMCTIEDKFSMDSLSSKVQIGSAIETLNVVLLDCFRACSSQKNISKVKNQWWCSELQTKRKALKKCDRRWRRFPSDENLLKLKKARKEFKDLKREKSLDSFKKFIENCNDPYKVLSLSLEEKDTMKSFLKDENGVIFEDNVDNAEYLLQKQIPDDDFGSDDEVATSVRKEVEEFFLNLDTNSFEEYPQITDNEVFRAFDVMSPYKSVPDDIFPVLIQVGIEILKFPLANLFNRCLEIGYFSILWKKGKVVIVPKSGKTDFTNVKSYRPITLLSIIGKGFERIILERLHFHSEKDGWISKCQFGFKKRISSEFAVYNFVKKVQSKIDKTSGYLSFFLDISGAFDKTWHPLILKKLIDLNFPKVYISI